MIMTTQGNCFIACCKYLLKTTIKNLRLTETKSLRLPDCFYFIRFDSDTEVKVLSCIKINFVKKNIDNLCCCQIIILKSFSDELHQIET